MDLLEIVGVGNAAGTVIGKATTGFGEEAA